MTLHDFVSFGAEWPKGAEGFIVGKGHVVWTYAYYPDKSNGAKVKIDRYVFVEGDNRPYTRSAFYDRECEIRFVDKDGKTVEGPGTLKASDGSEASAGCPQCSFQGTDTEVDDHRMSGAHRDARQAGSNLKK